MEHYIFFQKWTKEKHEENRKETKQIMKHAVKEMFVECIKTPFVKVLGRSF